jgi:hypothetical protein
MHYTADRTTVPPALAPDNLATATQLEADVALAEWQRQRNIPPERRVVGIDPAEVAYEATLDLVRRMVA